ncbi:MAG: hypothetical protein JWO66_1586, partial [Candidatus Eremiobacteraeota bacterium]|nr:hypothetical protein [Candidatus Eremiobacteraeota bacterium]
APLAGIVFVLASGPGTSVIALGQVALVSAAGIACALAAYERRAVAAGALATLVAALQPNLVLALIARMRDRTALLCATIAAAAFAALTLAAGGGAAGFAAYLHRLGEHGRAERFLTIQHTPAAIAWSFGATATLAAAAGTVCAVVAIAATIVATVRARLDPLDGTLLAIAALPLAVPFFHEHDFIVEFVPLIVVAVRARGRARAVAGVATILVAVDWLGLAQRPPAVAQIVALGLAVAFAFVVLGTGERTERSDAAPFIALLALACLAIPLAHTHPATTWPDALPPGYRAPASADASAVWADEQRTAGLAVQQPAWGALRAVPLAGCVVLGVAIVGSRRRRASTSASA